MKSGKKREFKVRELKRVSQDYLRDFASFLGLDFIKIQKSFILSKKGKPIFRSKKCKVMCEFLKNFHKEREKKKEAKEWKENFAVMEQKRKLALNRFKQLQFDF